MFMQSRRSVLQGVGGAVGTGALVLGGTRFAMAAGEAKPNNAGPGRLMLRGYDPVANFGDGAPTEGDLAIEVKQDGSTWRFASAGNRDAFLADPAKYKPPYGAYCAMGTALEHKIDGDSEVWRIVDDRLYLNVIRRNTGSRTFPGVSSRPIRTGRRSRTSRPTSSAADKVSLSFLR